jgi:hypothetical protein
MLEGAGYQRRIAIPLMLRRRQSFPPPYADR